MINRCDFLWLTAGAAGVVSGGFLAACGAVGERPEGRQQVGSAAGRGRMRDQVLPIKRCSRRIVPRLESEVYEVRYREFDGPHTVPREIARAALDWFTPG